MDNSGDADTGMRQNGSVPPLNDAVVSRPRSISARGKLRQAQYKASRHPPSLSQAEGFKPEASLRQVFRVKPMSRSQRPLPSLGLSASSAQRFSTRQWPDVRNEWQSHQRLFASQNISMHEGDDDRSHINYSGRLPNWLWSILTSALGIGSNERKHRHIIAVALHILTLLSGLTFAVSGLFFNIYDVLSDWTKTTVLVAICKCIPGAYWVGMGIYSHSLAARLFSNQRFVDCIRMHSKSIFKINTAFIILVLSVLVVGSNLYWNRFLLDGEKGEFVGVNGTTVRDANCVTAKVDLLLCQVFFGSRLVYSCFNLVWNLLVASILLSVCRTHTICIRRFMRELLCDTKIYEEFLMIQELDQGVVLVEESVSGSDSGRVKQLSTIMESHIWDDDIQQLDGDDDDGGGVDDSGARLPSGAHILQSMRSMRNETFDAGFLGPREVPMNRFGSSNSLEFVRNQRVSFSENPPQEHVINQDTEELIQDQAPPPPPPSLPFQTYNPHHHTQMAAASSTARNRQHSFSKLKKPNRKDNDHDGQASQAAYENNLFQNSGGFGQGDDTEPQSDSLREAVINGKPPILSNENLLFTYFQLVRRLSSTSRLLQRWMLTLITFTLMWCALLIIYFTSHDADWIGLVDFLLPLVILFLVSSAYAEVNLEGHRLHKFVLPTPERMSTLYYMQSVPLQLLVFSFSLSYSSIMTVVAGVAVTFGTRIILEQVGIS